SPSRSATACTSTTPSPTSRTLASTAPSSKISTVLCCVEPDETTTEDPYLRAVFGHAAPSARRMLPRQLVPRQRRRGMRVRRGLRVPHCRPACLRLLSPSTSTHSSHRTSHGTPLRIRAFRLHSVLAISPGQLGDPIPVSRAPSA